MNTLLIIGYLSVGMTFGIALARLGGGEYATTATFVVFLWPIMVPVLVLASFFEWLGDQ